MGHWVKKFVDGSVVRGSDEDVACGIASWSRSRNDGIACVELAYRDKVLEIVGAGEYWQSDIYECLLFGTSPVLVSRCIQRKISSSDIMFSVSIGTNVATISFNKSYPGWKPERITKQVHGKWLVLQYNIKENKIRYFISDSKV